MQEATTPSQKQIAKFVGRKSRQIAVVVRENVLPSKPLTLPDHNVISEREQRLQSYLQERSPQLESIPDVVFVPPRTSAMDDDSDAENDDDDSADHPDLAKQKDWFLSANAMQNLRENFRLFLSPAKAATADQVGDHAIPSLTSSTDPDEASGGEFGDTNSTTAAKTVNTFQGTKMLVMLASFLKVSSVWNYINSKKPLEPGLVRLNWTCVRVVANPMDEVLPSLLISDRL
ncbi:hypothetical protein L207DRAFT_266472 [Hyaloscypha variabilis F]|uniref:Uncharacterized protein n=1 Tax=Hyaloscypha variabilis (strain UAMH 11265 / GT02V1 / F) TaxID=1149755 RepID=A0A2J6RZ92_HYAVF|nr:hypothetical protein L207DRAFT_266472 [Hyaloscypha variabilis F]